MTAVMTPLELASTLEAKHAALVEAKDKPWTVRAAMLDKIADTTVDNLPTLLTALRESGEAIERAAKAERVVEMFMAWKAPERDYADSVDRTEPDYCPCCYGEHHETEYRGDCPFVAARALKPEPSR